MKMWVNGSTIENIKVSITKRKKATGKLQIIELTGEDAQKWGEAVGHQALFCALSGQDFPPFKWTVKKG